MQGINFSPVGFLFLVNVILLLLGCILDASTIILVIVPLFIPTCRALGVDLVHFGVVAVVNCMIGLITPPYGIVLFVINATTGIPLRAIISEIWPFIGDAGRRARRDDPLPGDRPLAARGSSAMPETRASPETGARSDRSRIRLALIGGNIRQSRSPELHRLCGELTGLEVTYDLLIPDELGQDFETTFDACARSGMRGVNITYPYKERVAGLGRLRSARGAHRLAEHHRLRGGRADRPQHRLFRLPLRLSKRLRPTPRPAQSRLIGAGGVGRAIAFALAELGASRFSLFDSVEAKARALARDLRQIGVDAKVASDVARAVAGADGIVNSTPVGMSGPTAGTPVPACSARPAALGLRRGLHARSTRSSCAKRRRRASRC